MSLGLVMWTATLDNGPHVETRCRCDASSYSKASVMRWLVRMRVSPHTRKSYFPASKLVARNGGLIHFRTKNKSVVC